MLFVDSKTLSSTYLTREAAKVATALREKIALATDVVVVVDAWTNSRRQSIMGIIVVLEDRKAYLLDAPEVSATSHTAEFVAGDRLRGHHCI